jgi:enterochelin esterase-like enzyme
VLVGVRAASPIPGDDASRLDRAREYVYGFEPDSVRFLKHEKFFMDEVAYWAEETLHASKEREARTIWGASNGGAFAVAMGLRHPDRFGHVIASSPVYNVIPPHKAAAYLPEFFLTAGTFEEDTRSRTVALANALRKLHAPVRYVETVGGHDDLIWAESFVDALERSDAALVTQ